MPEVGAGILPIRVEEVVIEGAREVVVVGDILLGLADRIELLQPPSLAEQAVDPLIKGLSLEVSPVARDDIQKIPQVASLFQGNPAIHVGFRNRSEEHTSELQSRGHLV